MQNIGREILIKEFNQRRNNNPMYSLRAFARDLQINRTTLSEVMSKKRNISKKNAEKLVENLSLSPIESDALMRSLDQNLHVADHNYLQIQDDVFKLMSDWYYFAILNLARIPHNSASPQWIADELGIAPEEIEGAIERLQRLGFLEVIEGKLVRTVRSLSTTKDVPSSALKIHHKQTLKLAMDAVDDTPVEEREITSVTFAIDPAKLPKAKEILWKCKRKIAKLLESGESKRLYLLSFQLFPLDNKNKRSSWKQSVH